MKKPRHASSENRLLSALSHRCLGRLLASCDPVELGFADVLCESGDRIRHVYFPTDGFISLVTVLNDSAPLEVGIVGDEGMLGASLILGVSVSPQRAVVQGAGAAMRMTAAAFQRHCRHNAELHERLDRYVYVLMSQLAQTAACTRYHLVEARLARWLLMSRDRAHRDRFHLTHEFLAYMLGVRRVGVTQAARALQERGLIEYSRGDIIILNSAGLERTACECYERGNEIHEQILGDTRADIGFASQGRQRPADSLDGPTQTRRSEAL